MTLIHVITCKDSATCAKATCSILNQFKSKWTTKNTLGLASIETYNHMFLNLPTKTPVTVDIFYWSRTCRRFLACRFKDQLCQLFKVNETRTTYHCTKASPVVSDVKIFCWRFVGVKWNLFWNNPICQKWQEGKWWESQVFKIANCEGIGRNSENLKYASRLPLTAATRVSLSEIMVAFRSFLWSSRQFVTFELKTWKRWEARRI